MIVAILIIVLGAIAVSLFLLEKCRKYSVKETMIKSIASLIFIVLGVYCSFSSGHHKFGIFVIIALVFGLLGDIYLDFKYVFPGDSKPFTYAGFTVFALGHVLFVIGMFVEFFPEGASPLYIIIPILSAFIAGTINVLLEKPMKLTEHTFPILKKRI